MKASKVVNNGDLVGDLRKVMEYNGDGRLASIRLLDCSNVIITNEMPEIGPVREPKP